MLPADARPKVTSYLINMPMGCDIFDPSQVDRTIEIIRDRLLRDSFFKENPHFRLVIGLNQNSDTFLAKADDGERQSQLKRTLERMEHTLKTQVREIADRISVIHYTWHAVAKQKKQAASSKLQQDADEDSVSAVNYSDIRNQLFLSEENRKMLEALKKEGGENQDIIYMTLDPDTQIDPSQLKVVEEKLAGDQAQGLLVAGYYEFMVKHPELVREGGKLVWPEFLIDQHQAYDMQLKKCIAEREFAVPIHPYRSIEKGSVELMKDLARSNLAILKTSRGYILKGIEEKNSRYEKRKKELPILNNLCELYERFLLDSSDGLNLEAYQSQISLLESRLLNKLSVARGLKTDLSVLGKFFWLKNDSQLNGSYFPFDRQAYFKQIAQKNIQVLKLKEKELGKDWPGAHALASLIQAYEDVERGSFELELLMRLSTEVEQLCEQWQRKKLDISSLSIFWSISGSSLLYPPEPALFMLLYKKRQQESLDVFQTIGQQDPHLFGQRGAGEGQELALRVTRIWQQHLKKSALLSEHLRPVHFSTHYRTKLPKRFKLGTKLLSKVERLPQDVEALRKAISDITERERLIKTLRECHQSCLQSALANRYFIQRFNYFRLEDTLEATGSAAGATQATSAAMSEAKAVSSSQSLDQEKRLRVFPKEHVEQLSERFLQYYRDQQSLIVGQVAKSTLLAIERALGIQSGDSISMATSATS